MIYGYLKWWSDWLETNLIRPRVPCNKSQFEDDCNNPVFWLVLLYLLGSMVFMWIMLVCDGYCHIMHPSCLSLSPSIWFRLDGWWSLVAIWFDVRQKYPILLVAQYTITEYLMAASLSSPIRQKYQMASSISIRQRYLRTSKNLIALMTSMMLIILLLSMRMRMMMMMMIKIIISG